MYDNSFCWDQQGAMALSHVKCQLENKWFNTQSQHNLYRLNKRGTQKKNVFDERES